MVKGRTRVRTARPSFPPIPQAHLPNPPITLLTDFGTADFFVAAMKGTILSINPEARVVDLTHEIAPYDVEAAAFTLLSGYRSFPAGTIHIAVVDPGVGSARRPILMQASNHSFIGPDNGVFSYICDCEADFRAFHLTNEKYFRQPVSPTFHGRDIFAPVAGVISLGVTPRELGTEISKLERLSPLQPQRLKNGNLRARVMHIDRFGNCITNISRDDFMAAGTLEIAGKTIKSFRRFFAEKGRDRLFSVWGSSGFLEIAARNASAAKLLGVKRGQSVLLSYKN